MTRIMQTKQRSQNVAC